MRRDEKEREKANWSNRFIALRCSRPSISLSIYTAAVAVAAVSTIIIALQMDGTSNAVEFLNETETSDVLIKRNPSSSR